MVIQNLYLILLLLSFCARADNLLEEASKLVPSGETKIFTTLIEEKQKELDQLKETKESLDQKTKDFSAEIKAAGQEVKTQISVFTDALQAGELDEFSQQKRALLHQIDQILKEITSAREKDISYIESLIRFLEEYLKDPDMLEYRAQLLKGRQTHSFEQFQDLYERLDDIEKRIAALAEKEKNVKIALINRQRAAEGMIQNYKKKREEYENSTSLAAETSGSLMFDASQRAELRGLEERLFQRKQQLHELRLQEFAHRIELIKTKRFIASLQRDAIREILAKVKSAIEINEADVALAKDELTKKLQQSFVEHERYVQLNDKLIIEQKLQERALDMASRQYSIALNKQSNYWAKEIKQSLEGFTSFLVVGHLYEQLSLTKRKKDLLRSQKELEEEKLRYEKVLIEAKDSFRKIMSRMALSEDDIADDIKKYETFKTEALAIISYAKERENSARDLLERQKRDLAAIELKREEIQKLRTTMFKLYVREYGQCLEAINSSYEKVKIQIEIISKVISIYADIIALGKKILRQTGFITKELTAVPLVWHRPEYAITWEGLKHVPSDIRLFIQDVYAHVQNVNLKACVTFLGTLVKNKTLFMWWFTKLLLVILFFVLMKLFGANLVSACLQFVQGKNVGFTLPILVVTCCFDFVLTHVDMFCLWLSGFILVQWYSVFDPYPFIVFCLLSIIFFIYVSYLFSRYIARFNANCSYAFWDPEQQQLMVLLGILVCTSILLLLFRQAFVIGTFKRSEVSSIMLAVSVILLQVALVFLILREVLTLFISFKTEVGRTLYTFFERYYYFLTGVIVVAIVMSNPYVGYGRLVFHIGKQIAYTIMIGAGLIGFHFIWRRWLARFFLFDEADAVKERFPRARTWYGFSVIFLFLTCVFLGMVLIAKIWGWPETLNNLSGWHDFVAILHVPVMLQKTANPISLYSLFQISFFIGFGVLISSIFNRLVLGRIYDILMLDAGIQNTLSSLARYLIITTAVIFGFQAVGLSSLIAYVIGALIIGIGWVVKDPISDVLAYFIILVQRPIKVGDLVQIDPDILGVVRRITPRSVIVRKKNSTTIVIPNMMILHKPITNWNYVRGFIAFDDILISIAYDANPQTARELLLRVLSENGSVLKNPKPVVRLDNFNEYGYVFMVRGYINSNYTLDMWDIASEIRLTIVRVLKENNIKIAVPVRVVINKNGSDLLLPLDTSEEKQS